MMRALLPVVLLWPALALADHELDDRDIDNGQILYREHCASCHGVRLEGQPNWRRPGLMEARGIAGFESGMPGLGDVMSDDEIWDVLAYIRST